MRRDRSIGVPPVNRVMESLHFMSVEPAASHEPSDRRNDRTLGVAASLKFASRALLAVWLRPSGE